MTRQAVETVGTSRTPGTGGPPISVSLACGFQQGRLTVRYRVVNHDGGSVYVFNRLWDLDATSKVIPDPLAAYRFVHEDRLRLFLGTAPLPSWASPFYKNEPYATEVRPHATLEGELMLAVPVKEYNVYSSHGDDDYEPTRVKTVELVVEYLRAAEVEVQPSPFYERALQVVTPGAMASAQLVSSPPIELELEALAHTGKFERLTFPRDARLPGGR